MMNYDQLDKAHQLELNTWRRHGMDADSVRANIKYFKGQREHWAKRLEGYRERTSGYIGGARETADHMIAKAEKDLKWYDDHIGFLEWLLNQPRLPEEIQATE